MGDEFSEKHYTQMCFEQTAEESYHKCEAVASPKGQAYRVKPDSFPP